MTTKTETEDRAELVEHEDLPSFIAALFRAEALARASAAYYIGEAQRLDSELRRRGARR